MAAENCVTCFLGAMDRLWFHQSVLFSEPSDTYVFDDNHGKISTVVETTKRKGSQIASTEQSNSPVTSSATDPKDETSSQESDERGEATYEERASRLSASSKTRSNSSSTATSQKRSVRLKKATSLKGLVELELEEVKGFMDLGFLFKKEYINYRTMSLIPGLQRLNGRKDEATELSVGGFESNSSNNIDDEDYELEEDDEEVEEQEETEGAAVMRPYLSEAWLIKKPDSPLLNIRIPRVSSNADMKRHLRYWARTVASEIQQVS